MSLDVETAKADLAAARSHYSGSTFFAVCGGPHATAEPKDAIDAGFDVAIRGEGEVSLVQAATAFAVFLRTQDSTVPDWSAVSGATYWKDIEHKEYAESKITAPLIVLDTSHPFCITPQLHPPIEIMRGCNCGCMYCQTPRLHAHKVRYRSLESIEQSVAHYAKVFAPPLDLRIIAPNALAYQSPDGKHPNLEALEALLALAKKNIARFYLGSFPSEVRPDFVTK